MQARIIQTPDGPIRISGEEMAWIGDDSRLQKLKALIVPPRDFNWPRMPVYSDDTLEKVCERWAKMYPTEANAMLADAKAKFTDLKNEKGFSTLKLMAAWGSVPDMIFFAMKHIDEDYWNKDAVKHFEQFRMIMPKLCTSCSLGYRQGVATIINPKETKDDTNSRKESQSWPIDDLQRRNDNIRKSFKKRRSVRRRNSGKLERLKLRN
jgi:hypothetical protein